jgi:glycosyltransferase involved in cell wall biosynthesis
VIDAGRPLSILHTESSNGWGGQEIRILTEAAGLRQRGHDVSLVAAPGARIVDEAPRFGVPVCALPIGRKRPAGLAAMARALGRQGFDIVNTHSSTDSWLAALAGCVLAARGERAPVMVRTRHVSVPVPNDPATRWLYGRATARTVTTGEHVREQLIRVNRLDPGRVDSVPTGIDATRYGNVSKRDARARLGLPQEVPLVGIVATLRSWKGHRYLVEALPRLSHADARLVIVGDGPQREALERQVDGLRLRGRVVFAGQQQDVADWLAALDVFALPSYANEGVPQALLQAMASGLPVIACPVGGIPECVRDLASVTLVPPKDVDALAGAMKAAVSTTPDPVALGRARARVVAEHSREVMYQRALRYFLGED